MALTLKVTEDNIKGLGTEEKRELIAKTMKVKMCLGDRCFIIIKWLRNILTDAVDFTRGNMVSWSSGTIIYK